MNIEDLTRVVILYEIYEMSQRYFHETWYEYEVFSEDVYRRRTVTTVL